MQIKVRSNDEGAVAWVVDPSQGENGETVQTVDLAPGQEVAFTVPEAHTASDIEVGEVTGGEAASEEPPAEGGAPDA